MAPNPVCNYPSVRKAALDIYETISAPKSKKYTARPYNRYAPEDSLWWLIPSTEWPAYKHGKITIYKESYGELFFGINIEKAINHEAAAGYQSRKAQKIIMDSEWCWYGFVKSLKNGEIAGAMNTIQENTNGSLLYLSLSGHIIDDPALFDPYSGHSYGDQVIWNYQSGNLISLVQPNHFFYPLKNVNKIDELFESINEIKELNWIWIDLYAGVILKNQAKLESDKTKQLYDGYMIWQKLIEPWENWLK